MGPPRRLMLRRVQDLGFIRFRDHTVRQGEHEVEGAIRGVC